MSSGAKCLSHIDSDSDVRVCNIRGMVCSIIYCHFICDIDRSETCGFPSLIPITVFYFLNGITDLDIGNWECFQFRI